MFFFPRTVSSPNNVLSDERSVERQCRCCCRGDDRLGDLRQLDERIVQKEQERSRREETIGRDALLFGIAVEVNEIESEETDIGSLVND